MTKQFFTINVIQGPGIFDLSTSLFTQKHPVELIIQSEDKKVKLEVIAYITGTDAIPPILWNLRGRLANKYSPNALRKFEGVYDSYSRKGSFKIEVDPDFIDSDTPNHSGIPEWLSRLGSSE